MRAEQAQSRQLRLDLAPERTIEALSEAAADWGGEWREEETGYLLLLPVTAGVRRGFSAARITVVKEGQGSRVDIGSIENHLEVNRGAAGVLAFGAMGAIVAILWPFFPGLLRLAPIAAVLAVVAWLLVAGRLRSLGLDEFFAMVEEAAADDDTGRSGSPA